MMKKLLLTLVIAAAGFMATQAQVNPHAIGLRLGGGTYYGGELSYQHGLGDRHRLELDLGFGGALNHSRLYLSGIYHWHWNIVSGLNWYVGPGASVGYYTWDADDSYIGLAVGGQIGIEFDFNALKVPLLVSVDARPMWDFLGDTHAGFGWGSAASVRYTF